MYAAPSIQKARRSQKVFIHRSNYGVTQTAKRNQRLTNITKEPVYRSLCTGASIQQPLYWSLRGPCQLRTKPENGDFCTRGLLRPHVFISCCLRPHSSSLVEKAYRRTTRKIGEQTLPTATCFFPVEKACGDKEKRNRLRRDIYT